MASYKTKLIVLSRVDFSESDRILTVYSLAYGLHKIIAKGSRKTLSHLGGKIEPYYCLFANLVEGKSFDIITDIQILSTYENIRKKLPSLRICYQISRLIKAIFHEKEPHQKIFYLVEQTLNLLDKKDNALAWPIFLSGLINELGYCPNLDICAICRNKLTLPINWSPSEGFCHQECFSTGILLEDANAKLLKLIISQEEIIMNLKLDQSNLIAITGYLEDYLVYHTGIKMEKIRQE